MSTCYRISTQLFGLLLLTVLVLPAHAQSDEEESSFPKIDFAVKAMQGAQFFRTDYDGDLSPSQEIANEGEFGFQRVRYNLEVNAQFHERISAFVDLGHEPNDFGSGNNTFAPAVDYAALDLMLTDQVTFRLGTPVTSLFNFRGYSDGAATQSNPLIGNSPIDFVTAETGIQLNGDFDGAGLDLTITSPTFFETFSPGTGLSILGKGRLMPSDDFSVGFGVGVGTNAATTERAITPGEEGLGFERVNWILGDGENYSAAGLGQPNRYTHAYLLPGAQPIMFQGDARFTNEIVEIDAWGGIGFEKYSFSDASGDPTTPRLGSGLVEEDSQMWWIGGTAKINATKSFFLSARGTYAVNSSDWAPDSETGLFRIQAGLGVAFWEHALWKIEFVSQDEGDFSPGQVGANWYGVLTELSLAF